MSAPIAADSSVLPPADPLRMDLHDEVHARPSPHIRIPARVTLIAVLGDGVDAQAEWAHLLTLPGLPHPAQDASMNGFLSAKLPHASLHWERHTEFTRYTIFESPVREGASAVPADWCRRIPGRLIAALQIDLVEQDISDAPGALTWATSRMAGNPVVASRMGAEPGHSIAVTNFRVERDGFERMLVLCPPGTSRTRAGRIAQRLLEIEVYRMMALLGLPVAKHLSRDLHDWEAALASVSARLESRTASEAELLDELIHVAAGVERAMAEHQYRFGATRAYDAIVQQRLAELREKPIPGTPTLGEFMRRRLSPAIGTVNSVAARLDALSERIERVGGLLRTRVDIATEVQNQQLLARLTRGQELQLKLQATVEGLSIAAISYYVISLLMYGAKALSSLGLPLKSEIVGGLMIPPVLWAVWWTTKRIHARLHGEDGERH